MILDVEHDKKVGWAGFIFEPPNFLETPRLFAEFIFQISTTKKIFLTKNLEATEFNQKIVATKLDKEIIYNENIILQKVLIR